MSKLFYPTAVLLLAANLQGAVITSVNFAAPGTQVTNAGNRAIGLDSTIGDTYSLETTGTSGVYEDSSVAIDQWTYGYQPSGGDTRLIYDSGTYYSNSDLDNLRGTILIMKDLGVTTGDMTVGLDFTIAAGDAVTLELYGWNSASASPTLSWGGPGGGAVWNDSGIGGATNLLAKSYTTGTSASEDINLGTGYDYYMWRVGMSGLNGQATDGTLATSGTTFSNISVSAVPEPSSAALLGLCGLALILRRRRA